MGPIRYHPRAPGQDPIAPPVTRLSWGFLDGLSVEPTAAVLSSRMTDR